MFVPEDLLANHWTYIVLLYREASFTGTQTYNHVILFISYKTLVTFIEIWLVGSRLEVSKYLKQTFYLLFLGIDMNLSFIVLYLKISTILGWKLTPSPPPKKKKNSHQKNLNIPKKIMI